MEARVLTIRVGIVLMISKRILVLISIGILSGCVGKASHPQCQNLKGEAFGARLGAAISGRYIDDMKANIADTRYERCEEMFDLIQYQEQLQETAQQERQESLQQQSAIAVSPTVQPSQLHSASLKDLVDCERTILEPGKQGVSDEKTKLSYQCELEIDRRVDTGIVGRDTVNKMLKQG
ncbi:hypothetical protein ACIPDS_02570 [Kluyvera sp. NPDC087067]|uniref:hypothetical protein n=2 Tax=unclassified Kluyvera TaxID=2619995 RepID=UPI00382AC025